MSIENAQHIADKRKYFNRLIWKRFVPFLRNALTNSKHNFERHRNDGKRNRTDVHLQQLQKHKSANSKRTFVAGKMKDETGGHT